MSPQKRGLFVTIQEEEWPPPAQTILGWWAHCLLGIKSEMKRVCLVENYTTQPMDVKWLGNHVLTIPAMEYFKFALREGL